PMTRSLLVLALSSALSASLSLPARAHEPVPPTQRPAPPVDLAAGKTDESTTQLEQDALDPVANDPAQAAADTAKGIARKPADAADTDAKWDVNAPHGPSKVVRFSTDEGTWMDVDVSPDGREIAFSLLGDLYRL